MKQLKTKAVVLSRINYREADRILTALTPNYGKLRLIARGARALKSKLAGGIELFAINDLCFIRGKGEIATLVSSRMEQNFSSIITDMERVQLGYEFLKITDKSTEDASEPEYYHLLKDSLEGLNESDIDGATLKLWFLLRLVAISGHAPNLTSAADGGVLKEGDSFNFNPEKMAFNVADQGRYDANHIKLLRLALKSSHPRQLVRVNGVDRLASELMPLISTMHRTHLYG